jgi:hypothetical protein
VFRTKDPERIGIFEIQFDKYSSDQFFLNAAVIDRFSETVVHPEINLKTARSWDGTWFWRVANPDRNDRRWRANDVIDSPTRLLASVDSAIDRFRTVPDHVELLDILLKGEDRTRACMLFNATVRRAKVAVALASRLRKSECRDQAEDLFREATAHWPDWERDRFLVSWP